MQAERALKLGAMDYTTGELPSEPPYCAWLLVWGSIMMNGNTVMMTFQANGGLSLDHSVVSVVKLILGMTTCTHVLERAAVKR